MGYTVENYEETESKQAFILDADTLRKFSDRGQRWINSAVKEEVVTRCEVFCSNSPDSLVYNCIEPVFGISNTKEQSILAILMHFTAGDEYEYKMRIQRHPEYPTILFKMRGPDQELLLKKYNEIKAEIKEGTQWYSFLSNRMFLRVAALKYNWIFWLLAAVFLVLGVWNYYAYSNNKRAALNNIAELKRLKENATDADNSHITAINQTIKNNEDYLVSLQKQNSFGTTIIAVAITASLFVVMLLCNKVLLYLYPRGVILIGAEIKRHEKLITFRKYVYGIISAVIAGIILKLVTQ